MRKKTIVFTVLILNLCSFCIVREGVSLGAPVLSSSNLDSQAGLLQEGAVVLIGRFKVVRFPKHYAILQRKEGGFVPIHPDALERIVNIDKYHTKKVILEGYLEYIQPNPERDFKEYWVTAIYSIEIIE